MARERLKKRMLTMTQRKLSENAPSRDSRFGDRVRRMIRPDELKSKEEMPWSGGKGTDVWEMLTAATEAAITFQITVVSSFRTDSRVKSGSLPFKG